MDSWTTFPPVSPGTFQGSPESSRIFPGFSSTAGIDRPVERGAGQRRRITNDNLKSPSNNKGRTSPESQDAVTTRCYTSPWQQRRSSPQMVGNQQRGPIELQKRQTHVQLHSLGSIRLFR